MNILFLNSIESTVYGGMEEWIRLVANSLASRGHAIVVAGRKDSQFLQRMRTKSESVELVEMDISGDFNPVTIARLKKIMTNRAIEIVTVNFNKDVRLGGIAARLGSSVRVVWSVGLDITSGKLIHKVLTPRLVDGVLVPSESLKAQITALGYIEPNIVEVIPIGIEDQPQTESREETASLLRARYSLPDESLVAVTSGRFVDQKGHIHLVEAMPEILKHCPDIRFLFLGDGPLEQQLRQRIDELSVARQVVFAGMRTDLSLELNGADMMIHPSIAEPFGIAVLEGMRAGLPVIASEVGGIPEVVGDVGAAILVSPGDSAQLAEAVVDLADSAEKRRSMGKSGRQRFEEEFGLDIMCDRIETSFLRLIRRKEKHGSA